MRSRVRGSSNSTMPRIATPTAPCRASSEHGLQFYGGIVTLEDTAAPQITGTPSGSLYDDVVAPTDQDLEILRGFPFDDRERADEQVPILRTAIFGQGEAPAGLCRVKGGGSSGASQRSVRFSIMARESFSYTRSHAEGFGFPLPSMLHQESDPSRGTYLFQSLPNGPSLFVRT